MSARLSLLQPARPTGSTMPSPFHGGLVTANAPPLRLPGKHFAAALTFLVFGVLGLAAVAPEIATGTFIAPARQNRPPSGSDPEWQRSSALARSSCSQRCWSKHAR